MTPEELHACYVTNHRRLYLVALAITMDRQTAEDAVHDTLEKLLRHPREPTDSIVLRCACGQEYRDRLKVPSAPCEVAPCDLVIVADEHGIMWSRPGS